MPSPFTSATYTSSALLISINLFPFSSGGLVFETKQKNFVFYELNTSVFEELMLWISQFMGGDGHEADTH